MADEHFSTGHGEFFPVPGDFSTGLGAATFFGSSYALPGLDAHAATHLVFGTVAWAADDDLQLPVDSSAAHFDSALSSLVSSPAPNASGNDVAIGDLIGRLGSICDAAATGSASNSCYSTPLSSPPRCASSAFRGYYHGGAAVLEAAGGTGSRLSRVASSKSLGATATPPPVQGSPEVETSPKIMGSSTETPDPVIMLPAEAAAKGNGGAARKRKASGKGGRASSSAMAAAAANASPKWSKGAVDGGGKTSKDDEDTDAAAEEEKPKPEPAKGYIHVRARRGQATDSHSLAERVRRERISERMKMLQSLVPGGNKITGKALMLDEIINYVQSLQRQVELATMNPVVAVELEPDAHYEEQLPAATLAYPTSAAAGLSSAYAAVPLFAASQTPQLDSWEAQDLHSTAAVHGHHDLYASPSPPAPQALHHHHNNSGFHDAGRQQEQQGAVSHSMKLEQQP
ncbi:hypothetical protein BS78_06G054600 [Paspalum vaginatum]|nr:hypothetical protein BS78_06G054600 [Paspalum vaginatum]KAJ1270476.1 hypothetical protein BS78_06G054600 [Paspalum vaginatum]KAJ1270477.1 hypothetical protein BS78_06G054600 [Paspalum vaginatum]